MKQVLETENSYLIGVATDNWRERIECGLPRDVEDIYWYDNVYEATAAAVNLSQKNKPIRLMVMIDCLSHEEMDVFATLAGMDKVQTTAVSGTGNKLKMRQAESLGADKIVLLSELSQSDTVEESFVAEAESPVTETEPSVTETEALDTDGLPKKIVQEYPSEIQKGATLTPVADTLPKSISEPNPLRPALPNSPRRKPPIIEREENQPLLTPEELDALLG